MTLDEALEEGREDGCPDPSPEAIDWARRLLELNDGEPVVMGVVVDGRILLTFRKHVIFISQDGATAKTIERGAVDTKEKEKSNEIPAVL